MTTLSIIVPVLDEEAQVVATLGALAPLRDRGVEVIVADGGSRDRTVAIASPLADRVIVAARGRAVQMNAGANAARGQVLLFLHADTLLPERADELITCALAESGRVWGRFDIDFAGTHPLLRIVGIMMNLRSRLTGIATGDQGLFMTREAYRACGGFPEIALMEDIAMSVRLKRLSRPICLRATATTSARRWESRGVLRTVIEMWLTRLAYFFGADPSVLARRYYGR